MKKTLSIVVLSVFVWGCSHKITPATTGSGTGVSNTGTPVIAPAVKSAASTPAAAPVTEEKTAPPAPAEAPKTSSPETLGQSIFNTKCGHCHGLKVTTDYTADRWVGILEVMANKAQLTDGEKENVLAYVKANAKK